LRPVEERAFPNVFQPSREDPVNAFAIRQGVGEHLLMEAPQETNHLLLLHRPQLAQPLK